MATAETKLNDAKTKIIDANALLAVSVDKLSEENKAKLKTLAKDIQSLIKEAHKALNDSIKSLKDAVKIKMKAEASANATTSATTETETAQ